MLQDPVLVCRFDHCDKSDLPLVGGKCASLGELIKADIRVPPGFAVTTEGYNRFIAQAGIAEDIFALIEGIGEEDIEEQDKVSGQIRALIEAAPFSIELEDQIGEHYRTLSMHCNRPAVPVAVRSSATSEDLPDASFAGQQDTFLWVRGMDDVLRYTKKCFSSLYTARAIAYRIRNGFDHRDVAISVGIQKMANSYAAGVMFTINPANGDNSMILINSSFGFGEAVVSGEVTPDEFLVNKVSLDTVARTITRKEVAYLVDYENQVSTCVDLPAERQNVQSIVDEEVSELARLGKAIEKHYGRAMDIEWAVDNDMPAGSNIFILQARPETIWNDKKAKAVSKPGASAMDHILSTIMTGVKLK